MKLEIDLTTQEVALLIDMMLRYENDCGELPFLARDVAAIRTRVTLAHWNAQDSSSVPNTAQTHPRHGK